MEVLGVKEISDKAKVANDRMQNINDKWEHTIETGRNHDYNNSKFKNSRYKI